MQKFNILLVLYSLSITHCMVASYQSSNERQKMFDQLSKQFEENRQAMALQGTLAIARANGTYVPHSANASVQVQAAIANHNAQVAAAFFIQNQNKK